MGNDLLTLLMKFVLGALGIVGTYALARLTIFLDAKKSEAVSKDGAVAYNHAIEVAKGLYLVLESEFDGILQAGSDKKDEMEKRLLEIFPQLTQAELDAINKTVSKELNDKILVPILTPVLVEVKKPTEAIKSGIQANTLVGKIVEGVSLVVEPVVAPIVEPIPTPQA